MLYLLRIDPHLPWQPAAVEAAKRAAYDGFRAAAELGPGSAQFGVIVDGRSTLILRDAIAHGFRTVCTVLSTAAPPREHEDCDEPIPLEPAAHDATYWRVVVRFNPSDESGLAPPQLACLRRLSETLTEPSGPRLICDLVVPPTKRQLTYGIRAFDRELLPELTGTALARLAEAGVSPEMWAIEGFEQPDEYARVLAVARRACPTVGCVVRAAGHSEATTLDLMAIGLATPGVDGVILGPAPFWEHVETWMMGRTTRGRAVAGIADQLRGWIDRLEAGRAVRLTEEHC